MGTHPIFESDFDCLTDGCRSDFAPLAPPVPSTEPKRTESNSLAMENETLKKEQQALLEKHDFDAKEFKECLAHHLRDNKTDESSEEMQEKYSTRIAKLEEGYKRREMEGIQERKNMELELTRKSKEIAHLAEELELAKEELNSTNDERLVMLQKENALLAENIQKAELAELQKSNRLSKENLETENNQLMAENQWLRRASM